MTSSGSPISASTASCRSWVAEQMVSNDRKCSATALGAVAALDAAADLLRDRQRLAGEHGGLVGDPDALQVPRKVEARRRRLRESGSDRARVAAALDEVADDPRLVHVEQDEVPPARVLHDLARGGLGLLVVVLAVDDGRVAVARVALDPLPDVEHRAAGGIHQHAADASQPVEVVDGHAERGQDDDVLAADRREVEAPLVAAGQEPHPHRAQLVVDVGVVNDLAHEVEPPVGKLEPGLVRVVHRAIHAVAEPELPGEPEAQRPDVETVLAGAQGLDHRAVVVGRELAFDLGLEAEAAAVVGALHRAPNLHPTRSRAGPQARAAARSSSPGSPGARAGR